MLLGNTRGVTFWIAFIPDYGPEVILFSKHLSKQLLKIRIFVLIHVNCNDAILGQEITRHSDPSIHHR